MRSLDGYCMHQVGTWLHSHTGGRRKKFHTMRCRIMKISLGDRTLNRFIHSTIYQATRYSPKIGSTADDHRLTVLCILPLNNNRRANWDVNKPFSTKAHVVR